MSSPNLIHKQDGVILVIIPVILLLIGLVIAYMMRSVQTPVFYKEHITSERMQETLNVLSAYVQRYNRLPCPARPDGLGGEPFGFEVGSGANGDAVPATCAAWREGILPYKTLGLTQDYARDAWGGYITYAISPAFAVNPVVDRHNANPALAVNDRLPRASAAADMRVHAACRNATWIEAGRTNFTSKAGTIHTLGGTFNVARNPWKARFCCASITTYNENTDLVINVNGVNTAARTGVAGSYATADVIAGAGGGNIETPVVVLVSHGANGFGAYLVNGTNNKFFIGGAGVGPNETENLDGTAGGTGLVSRTYYQGPRTYLDSGAGYFDDIVMFRTQDSLYAQTGRSSCSSPY